MKGRAIAGAALLVTTAAVLWTLDTEPLPAQPLPGGGSLGGPQTCLPCHASVVEEWRASMHAAAFTDPQVRAPRQADDFRKTECLPCHAPRSVFEHGIEEGARVLARVERRADGVDCLGCHGLPEGGVASTRSGLDAACRPVLRPELSTHRTCAACHDQHNTHQEWLASPAAARGQSCADCHMPRVRREGDEAGAPRAGRSHHFEGGRDRDFALAGLTLDARVDAAARRLDVTLTNVFAGHNLPTDSRNRALDLVVTLFDRRGLALPPPADEAREPWETAGTARRRFRNPYRSSGAPSTQLPAGQTSVLAVPLPSEATRASVALLYKLQPFIGDESAHWSRQIEVALP